MARRPAPPAPSERRRSHAAAPVTVVLLLVGILLGTYTVLVPAAIGLYLLLAALSFLSTHVNPFSIGFYLATKPSWTVIGLLLLSATVLLGLAYGAYVTGAAPLLPGLAAGR